MRIWFLQLPQISFFAIGFQVQDSFLLRDQLLGGVSNTQLVTPGAVGDAGAVPSLWQGDSAAAASAAAAPQSALLQEQLGSPAQARQQPSSLFQSPVLSDSAFQPAALALGDRWSASPSAAIGPNAAPASASAGFTLPAPPTATLLELAPPRPAAASPQSLLSSGEIDLATLLSFQPPFRNAPPTTPSTAEPFASVAALGGSGQALPPVDGGVLPPAFGAASVASPRSFLQAAQLTRAPQAGDAVALAPLGFPAVPQAPLPWDAEPILGSNAILFQQQPGQHTSPFSSWLRSLPFVGALLENSLDARLAQSVRRQRKAGVELLTMDTASALTVLVIFSIVALLVMPVISVVIFDAFVDPRKRRSMRGTMEDMPHDDAVEVDLGDPTGMVPVGNIFRHCGRTTERLKHQNDINRQIAEIAGDEHIAQLLDAYPWPESHARMETLKEERHYKLSYLLVQALESVMASASPAPVEGGSPRPKAQMKGVEFLADVVKSGPCKNRMGGWMVLPNDRALIRNWTKDRFMAVLLGLAMIMSPVFMMVAYSHIFVLHFLTEPANQRLSFAELACLGPRDQACSTLLGAVFLVFILEYERFVVRKEKAAFYKMQWLPADRLWTRTGQLANAFCLLFTAMVIPLVFWSEQDSKDIVFDSMGMLFIFGMDDLSSEAMSYLEMSDEDFQQTFADFMLMLLHCPLNMEDLVDYDAKNAEAIWVLDFSEGDGIFCTTRDSESGKPEPCFTRLFLAEGNDKSELVYSVVPDDSKVLGGRGGLFAILWDTVYWVLIAAELTFPLTYLLMGDPCYD